MTVNDVFFIRGRGTIVKGMIDQGTLRVGEHVRVNDGRPVRVGGIEASPQVLEHAEAGQIVGLLLSSVDRCEVSAGNTITSALDGTSAVDMPLPLHG